MSISGSNFCQLRPPTRNRPVLQRHKQTTIYDNHPVKHGLRVKFILSHLLTVFRIECSKNGRPRLAEIRLYGLFARLHLRAGDEQGVWREDRCPGDEPRRIFDELGKISLVDVVLPTRNGMEIRRRVRRPTDHQAILLQRLALNLPRQVIS